MVVNVSGQCIAARLAMYLREYFADYDVDVEYNRHHDNVKQLRGMVGRYPRDRDEGTQCQSVLPDVVVHRRGVGDSNLLVIKMKKSSNREGVNGDRQRIMTFREQLGYDVGALVVCQTGDCPAMDAEIWV